MAIFLVGRLAKHRSFYLYEKVSCSGAYNLYVIDDRPCLKP